MPEIFLNFKGATSGGFNSYRLRVNKLKLELERVVSLSVSTNDGGGGNGAPGGAGGGRRQAAHLIHVPVLVNDTSVALPFQTLCGDSLGACLCAARGLTLLCWQPSRSCSAPGRSSQASTTRAATLATPAATLAGQCPCSPHVDI